VFKMHPALMLPERGLWSFEMLVTSFMKQDNVKPFPLI
jgi:hypothetical protein